MTVEPAFLRREAAWVCLCSQRQGCHQNHCLTGNALNLAYSTAVAAATILGFTPHHSYDCHGFTFWWVFSSGSTVVIVYLLVLAC
jgi:hypothetical protein